mmetsp:Transcript_46603/g.78229  ORF Transcript_46603/g.78229 Transcript_46603/m.78229 type:complete len:257 (+) Transcript_46603:192-962(+)
MALALLTVASQHIDAVRQCAVLSLEAQHKGLDGSGDADGPEVLGHFAAVGVVHDSHEGVVVQCKPDERAHALTHRPRPDCDLGVRLQGLLEGLGVLVQRSVVVEQRLYHPCGIVHGDRLEPDPIVKRPDLERPVAVLEERPCGGRRAQRQHEGPPGLVLVLRPQDGGQAVPDHSDVGPRAHWVLRELVAEVKPVVLDPREDRRQLCDHVEAVVLPGRVDDGHSRGADHQRRDGRQMDLVIGRQLMLHVRNQTGWGR